MNRKQYGGFRTTQGFRHPRGRGGLLRPPSDRQVWKAGIHRRRNSSLGQRACSMSFTRLLFNKCLLSTYYVVDDTSTGVCQPAAFMELPFQRERQTDSHVGSRTEGRPAGVQGGLPGAGRTMGGQRSLSGRAAGRAGIRWSRGACHTDGSSATGASRGFGWQRQL